MRILIATPLYPPDIAEPAPYIKELAEKIASEHMVTIFAFGDLVEKVPRVHYHLVSKKLPLVLRLCQGFRALYHSAQDAEVIIGENGTSIEILLLFISLSVKKPIILHIGDTRAESAVRASPIRSYIYNMLCSRAYALIKERPNAKPEILPFSPYPHTAMDEYEISWSHHLQHIKKILAGI